MKASAILQSARVVVAAHKRLPTAAIWDLYPKVNAAESRARFYCETADLCIDAYGFDGRVWEWFTRRMDVAISMALSDESA